MSPDRKDFYEYLKFLYGLENIDFKKLTQMLSSSLDSGIQEQGSDGPLKTPPWSSAYMGDEQIGFCRAVSDKTRFAYIMDVFIDERYRRMGIGKGC